MTQERQLLFGTGGVPRSCKSKSTAAGIQRIAELGLGCMEVEFVHGANMTDSMAKEVGALAKKLNVRLTAHAPYYINLNAREPKKVAESQKRLTQTVHIASLMGAESVVFHPAYYLKDHPHEVYNRVRDILVDTVKSLRESGIHLLLRTETTGKGTQFGNLEELLNLCVDVDGIATCIDFAHMHARGGECNSYGEFLYTLNRIAVRLGWHALENMHIHISGIKYSEKGELEHLNLKESDLRCTDLLKALKDLDVQGTVICESPNLEEDALLMQEAYDKL